MAQNLRRPRVSAAVYICTGGLEVCPPKKFSIISPLRLNLMMFRTKKLSGYRVIQKPKSEEIFFEVYLLHDNKLYNYMSLHRNRPNNFDLCSDTKIKSLAT